MANYPAKHEFVDDYPYLAYASEVDTVAESGEGGGGGGSYTLPVASADTLGGVKIGSGLAIDSNGVLSSSGESYTLPTASADTLGGVKVGSGLAIDNNGVLSSSGESYTLPTASADTLGGVKVKSGLDINSNGELSLKRKIIMASVNQSTGAITLPDTFADTVTMYKQYAVLDIVYEETANGTTMEIYERVIAFADSKVTNGGGMIITAKSQYMAASDSAYPATAGSE